MGKRAKALENELIGFALGFPEATIEHPWDQTVVKVRGKVFVFFGGNAGPPDALSMTVKLPISAEMAVLLEGVEPAGYGLGRTGWVSVHQSNAKTIDAATLRGWIAQSYRARAPRGLVTLTTSFDPTG